MGKEHKKHKKHKHSKHKHKSKDEGYHVPVVPLKSEMRPKTAAAPSSPSVTTKQRVPIGPILPAGPPKDGGKPESSGQQNESYGPSLPPHLVQQKRAPGPLLPSDFKTEETIEPVDDEISGFGPLPAELISSDSERQFVQKQLELRAEYMKRKFAGEVCVHSCSTVGRPNVVRERFNCRSKR